MPEIGKGCRPKKVSHADGPAIRHTKRVRKALPSNSSVEEGRSCFPTVCALTETSDEALIKTLVEGENKVCYPNCNALGALSPVGKVGSAGFRRRSVGSGLANPSLRGLALKSLFLGVH